MELTEPGVGSEQSRRDGRDQDSCEDNRVGELLPVSLHDIPPPERSRYHRCDLEPPRSDESILNLNVEHMARIAVRHPRELPTNKEFLPVSTTRFISR